MDSKPSKSVVKADRKIHLCSRTKAAARATYHQRSGRAVEIRL